MLAKHLVSVLNNNLVIYKIFSIGNLNKDGKQKKKKIKINELNYVFQMD